MFNLEESLRRLVNQFKTALADRVLTWEEAKALLYSFLDEAMALAAQTAAMTGGEKRMLVLQAAGMLIDYILAGNIKLGFVLWLLAWLSPAMKSALKASLLTLLDQALEQNYFKKYRIAA